MFDLKHEVETWTEKTYVGPCDAKAATLAELQDHLYCEVERLEAEGMSQEQAFRSATAQLGAAAGQIDGQGDDRALRQGRIGNAILWAALIIVISIVFFKSPANRRHAVQLTALMLPLWFATDQLLARRVRRSPES